MKLFNYKKVKTFLLSGLAVLSVAFGALLYTAIANPVKANADTLSSTVYQTDGASVRIFKKTIEGDYEETDRQGIRFHVEMGAGYKIPNTNTPVLDVTQTNKNGSYKLAEGYKSYTLALPTRLMGGSYDLTMDLEKVMVIDTSEYWYTDVDGNWESVAYIYNVPEKWYTDEFTYRGIVVSVDGNGNETPVMWTDMETRSLAEVAKKAYKDTMDENTNYWGTAERDTTAAPLIKKFVPTYTVNYKDGGSEEVLWGDKLANADQAKTYYDETNHEPIDVTKPLEMSTSCTITLESTEVSSFVFTGVEYTAEGFNVFATLPTEDFGHDVELEPSAVDMVTSAGNVVKATSVKVHVTGTGLDAVSELQIGFSYENITNGTKLTILNTSHFYNNGVLYELSKDYEFEYYNNTWELPLGQITLADFAEIKNYSETDDATGETEHNVRISFTRDFLVNGGVVFKDANGQPAEITITCSETHEVKKRISDGYYYWNQGQVSILEIPGSNGGDFWGEHDDDVMTIPAGTRVYQNNGYYLVSEAITATFDGGETWVFEPEYNDIDASYFTSAYTRQEGDTIYIDVKTTDAWASDRIKVVCNGGKIVYNHTDNVTKHEITEVFYHGENGNQLLRLHIDAFSVMGDWVTIPEGTELWVGNKVFRLTEDVISYFVDTKQWDENAQEWAGKGATWITNPVLHDITQEDFTSIKWYQSNIRFETVDLWSSNANNKVIMDDTYIDGNGVIATGTNYSGFYYYGATNKLLEMQGVNFDENGGSVLLKSGVFFWIFNNANFDYVAGYRLAEDITIEVSGANGSQIYKDTEVLSITKADIASCVNDGSHSGEIRIFLTGTKISNMYGAAVVEGSATINGNATTSAFVYGGDGTSGYSGNTIIAFTGEAFGKPFQATAKGDIVKIAAGTKVWLSNGSGYVTFADELVYVWKNTEYVPQTEHTLTINSGAAPIKTLDSVPITAPMTVKTGDKVQFAVEVPAGYKLASVSNATLVGSNGNIYYYETDYIFGDVTVLVACSEPILINQSSIENLISYYNAENTADFEGFRLQLKATDEINAVATKYSGTFEGTIEMKVGTTTSPTIFHYYGDGNRMIAIGCDISGMQAGDYLTIKAGSIFVYGAAVFKVESDINIITVTANFDENINGLSLNGQFMTPGKPMAFLTGAEVNVVYGWRNGSEATHTLAAVRFNGEDKGNSGTYGVTLNETTVIDVVTFVATDIANTISIENWATHDGEDFYFFAIKASSEEYIHVGSNMKDKYWNDQADNIKGYNHGVDLMEYIYINGVSARELVTTNKANNQYTGTTFPFSESGVYAPVTVETGSDGTAGVWMKVMKAFASELEITVKKGFTVVGANGNNYYVSRDVSIFYANGTVGSKNNTAWVSASNATVNGVTDGQGITYGETYNFTVSAPTGYNLTSVKINDAEQGTSGSYSFTADVKDVTIVVETTPKTYKATVSASNATVSGVTNNQAITHDQTYSFTVTANSGYALTSVKIGGVDQGAGGSYSFTASGATSIVVETKKTYTVTASCSGGVSVSNTPQTVMEGGSVTFNLNVPSNATIKANGTEIGGTSYTVSNVTANTTVTFTTWYTVKVTSLTEGSVKVNGTNRSVNWSQLVESGKTITVQATYNQDDDRKCTAGSESWTDTNSHTVTVSGKTDITVYSKKSCLVEGTMIMMADGTQKAVENIVAGDMVMVFNHETGKYQASAIWFNDHADEPACVRDVINLEFANGAKARIAYEHAYFDLDLMRYVFIREDNMHEFIGHRFVTATYNGTEMVQGETTLVKAYITEEVVKVYGPITEYHFNLISDDMLSMPSFNFNAVGMINIFDYDEDLSYNEEKMQADIEQYGLFTYEEFSAFMSYEDFCKAPIQYFKVAIGKGNLTWEQIELTLQYLAVNEFAS